MIEKTFFDYSDMLSWLDYVMSDHFEICPPGCHNLDIEIRVVNRKFQVAIYFGVADEEGDDDE